MTQMIPVAMISWPNQDKEVRTFVAEQAKKLAVSIGLEGLHHPILVRPDPATPGRYIGVAGRHRHYAVADMLKRAEIEAKVLKGQAIAKAEQITLSENLFRNPLTGAQQLIAIKRWNDFYDKERQAIAQIKKDRVATQAAKAGKGDEESGLGQVGPAPTPAPEPTLVMIDPDAEKIPAFSTHVAEVTGKSPRTAKRTLQIANAFDEEQLEVFHQKAVPQMWMEAIAKLPADEKAKAVNLIASGKEPGESVSLATGKDEVQAPNGTVVVAQEPEAPGEAEMTDDAWVEFYCSEILGQLPHKAQFREDAIFYRRTRDLRLSFKSKVGKSMKNRENALLLGFGSFFSRVLRSVSVAHPSKWFQCGNCKGQGVVSLAAGAAKDTCKKCYGAGYQVKMETR